MNSDEIANIAQTISFAFEDNYTVKAKKEAFIGFFDKYLAKIEGAAEAYDAIVVLGRENPEEFEQMVKEMKEQGLIS